MNLKKLVNDKQLWEDFLLYLDGEIQQCYKTLASATEHDSMIREQGKIKAYEKMKWLRKKVNDG